MVLGAPIALQDALINVSFLIKQPFIIGTIFYSGIDEGELDGEQIHLLELFAKVPQSKRKIVFELLRNLSDEK